MFMLSISIAVSMIFYTFFFKAESFKELKNIKALKKVSVLTII